IIVGSPAYFARCSHPTCPADLLQHACLRLRRSNGALATWSLIDGGREIELAVRGPFIANDYAAMLRAAVEGVGLAQVPEPIAADLIRSENLVHVLEAFAPMAPGVFLYYPSRHQIMPKLRAFIDHVKSRSRATRQTRARVRKPA